MNVDCPFYDIAEHASGLRDVPVDANCVCDRRAEIRDKMKGTFCRGKRWIMNYSRSKIKEWQSKNTTYLYVQ